ncbi:MAG: HDOD domain-containing protein [Formivibrio sp.]|nr:HDOD domain-containing protein [Formivibrio sp.]
MKLEAVFEQTHRLPTVPKVVQELIDSFNKADIDISAIAARVALDQVIAAKTLRLANSAHFAPTKRIGSLNEAVMVLGFSTLRTLVLASGITGAFITTPGFDRKSFWRHSLDIAAYARWLARLSGEDTDAAFTCGLTHNIGELLIHVVSPELAVHIDRSVEKGADRRILEDNNIGFDYIDVGAELARRWNFPEAFRLAILHQNAPLRNPESGPLGLILHLAICLSESFAQPAHTPESIVDNLPQAELAALKLDRDLLVSKLAEAQIEAEKMEDLLG